MAGKTFKELQEEYQRIAEQVDIELRIWERAERRSFWWHLKEFAICFIMLWGIITAVLGNMVLIWAIFGNK